MSMRSGTSVGGRGGPAEETDRGKGDSVMIKRKHTATTIRRLIMI